MLDDISHPITNTTYTITADLNYIDTKIRQIGTYTKFGNKKTVDNILFYLYIVTSYTGINVGTHRYTCTVHTLYVVIFKWLYLWKFWKPWGIITWQLAISLFCFQKYSFFKIFGSPLFWKFSNLILLRTINQEIFV